MVEEQSRASWERGLVTDARGWRVSQLDPVIMDLAHRHDEIPAETLGSIAREVGLGMNRTNRVLLWATITCLVSVVVACVILWIRYSNGTISLRRLVLSLVPYGCIWLAPYGFWMGTRNARFQRITKVMLRHQQCPHCGYDLRGLVKDEAGEITTCPECGCGWHLDNGGSDGSGDNKQI